MEMRCCRVLSSWPAGFRCIRVPPKNRCLRQPPGAGRGRARAASARVNICACCPSALDRASSQATRPLTACSCTNYGCPRSLAFGDLGRVRRVSQVSGFPTTGPRRWGEDSILRPGKSRTQCTKFAVRELAAVRRGEQPLRALLLSRPAGQTALDDPSQRVPWPCRIRDRTTELAEETRP